MKLKELKYSIFTGERADIICLQETHCASETEEFWHSQWGGVTFASHGTSKSRGVVILVRNSLCANFEKIKKDDEGRIISVTFKIDEKRINLITVYAPNKDTLEFSVHFIHM